MRPQHGVPHPAVLAVPEQSGRATDCLQGQEVEGVPLPSLQALLGESLASTHELLCPQRALPHKRLGCYITVE